MLREEEKYKYELKNKLMGLTAARFKDAKVALPRITGYNWKTIWYQWCEIKLSDKRSIPSEPLDQMANWLNCDPEELKNYTIKKQKYGNEL